MRRKVARLKWWDGKVHLFKEKTRKLYVGLRHRLEKFASDRNYTISYSDEIKGDTEFSLHEAAEHRQSLNLPKHLIDQEYQLRAFAKCVKKGRVTVLCPTGSGKSLIIYMLTQYYNRKTLIIVPTIGLIEQLQSHFKEYGYKGKIHPIYAGQEKNDDANIYVSTWQSLADLPKEYFEQFGMVIVDEVHGAEAKSLRHIMESLEICDLRFGFTGTLKDLPTHRLTIEGLFGEIFEVIKTHELITQGILTPLEIKVLILKYQQEYCKAVKGLDYPDELKFIVGHSARKKFLNNLILSLKGNTIVLFRLVDLQGKVLIDELQKLLPKDRPLYFIYGATPLEEREQIRQILATQENAVLVGSYGCVSTGLDAPNLRHLICASPYKSKIKVLQAIGRILRKLKGKDKCIVYDVVDDLTFKTHQNFALKHCIERVKLYNEEKFPYKTYRLELKG